MRQEVAVAVAKADIGDALGLGGVLLDLPPRTEAIVGSDACQQVIETGIAKPRPLTPGKQDVPGNNQDILAGTHDKSLATRSLTARAVSDCGRHRTTRAAARAAKPAALAGGWTAVP